MRNTNPMKVTPENPYQRIVLKWAPVQVKNLSNWEWHVQGWKVERPASGASKSKDLPCHSIARAGIIKMGKSGGFDERPVETGADWDDHQEEIRGSFFVIHHLLGNEGVNVVEVAWFGNWVVMTTIWQCPPNLALRLANGEKLRHIGRSEGC